MQLFDLQANIVSRYQGEARLQRLLWIASTAGAPTAALPDAAAATNVTTSQPPHLLDQPNPDLAREALELAHQYSQEQGNLRRYKEVIHLQQQQQSSQQTLPQLDTQWLNQQDHKNAAARQILQQRLQSAQSHLNKEAIRVAYQALATHDEQTGNLNDAFYSVIRAKDYCTSRPQQVAVSLHILQNALYLQNYKTVQEYTQKLVHMESTTAAWTNATTSTGSTTASTATQPPNSAALLRYKVHVAAALERLAAREYAAAAHKLMTALYAAVDANHHHRRRQENNNSNPETSTSSSPGGTAPPACWNAVLAPEGVALFGAFLALAALEDDDGDSRHKKNVNTTSNTNNISSNTSNTASSSPHSTLLALAEHPEALELAPAARQAVILAAKRYDYAGAWKLLQTSGIFDALQFDLYMGMHLPDLKQSMRDKFLRQHWKAYQCVSLQTLQQSLGPGILPHDPLQVLPDKIAQGCLPADTRLDWQHQTLVRVPTRKNEKLPQLTAQVLDDTYSMVIRLACLEEHLSVADPAAKRKARGAFYGTQGSVVLMDSEGDDDDDDDEHAVAEDDHDADTSGQDVTMSDAGAAVETSSMDDVNPQEIGYEEEL